MSQSQNFSVNINLSNFFQDHRSRARIFINNDIETIKDLQDRIQKIFRIDNFILISENYFLPPSEDIKILQKHEILWVLPDQQKSETECLQKKSTKTKINKTTRKENTKKKSYLYKLDKHEEYFLNKQTKAADNISEEDNESMREGQNLTIKSISEKRKVSPRAPTNVVKDVGEAVLHGKDPSQLFKMEIKSDKLVTNEMKSATKPNSSKVKVNKLNTLCIDSCSKSSSSDNNISTVITQKNMNNERKSNHKHVSQYKNQRSCKGDLSTYKKNVVLPTITDKYLQKKKINIVKIDYVVNKNANVNIDDLQANITNHLKGKDQFIDISKNLNNLEEKQIELGELPSNSLVLSSDLNKIAENGLIKCNSSWKDITHEETINIENNEFAGNMPGRSSNLFTFDKKNVGDFLESNANLNDTSHVAEKYVNNNSDILLKLGVNTNENFETNAEKSQPSLIKLKEQKLKQTELDSETDKINYLKSIYKEDSSIINSHFKNDIESCSKNISALDNSKTSVETVSDQYKTSHICVNHVVNKSIPNISSSEEPKCLEGNFICLDNEHIPPISEVIDHDNDNSFNISEMEKKSYTNKKQSGLGYILEELRSNDSIITSEDTLNSDVSNFTTKRSKRTRVRKRKKKGNETLNENNLIIEPKQPKLFNVKSHPLIHIKFEIDDEKGENLKYIDLTEAKNTDKGETESHIETSHIENTTLTNDFDNSKLDLKDEDILKSPIMIKMLPKIGDIIAFKILRLTENYTPEVSSYITGKVLYFNIENAEILYEILNGLHLCDELTRNPSMEADSSKVKSNQRIFQWADLVEPRLLFP